MNRWPAAEGEILLLYPVMVCPKDVPAPACFVTHDRNRQITFRPHRKFCCGYDDP